MPEWAERLIAEVNAYSWIRFGTFKQRTQQVTNRSVVTTATGNGLLGKSFSSGETAWSPPSDFVCYEENGKRLMSDSKGIQFKLGGKFQFVVTKTFVNDIERFSVRIGNGEGYVQSYLTLADDLTWAEASAAMNKFRDEFDDAFETLVQVSTLTTSGAHEES